MKQWLLLLVGLVGISAPLSAAQAKVKVTTTVSMVTDLVKQVGGDRVEVQGLMGAGVDPHLYKATAADVSKLRQADVIFYNGLLLEGKMQEVLTTLAKGGRRAHAITDSIPIARLTKPPEFDGHHDPHVWFDVSMWRQCVPTLVKGLIEADPAGRTYYEQRGADVEKKLQDLHDWALKKAGELAPEKRILVTSHDAYNYFGRAYGFKVVGLQGISTVTEASLSDVVKLVDFIKAKKIKAIFVESSVPHNTIERISKDAGVKIGGELFSDAMGTPGQMENGYDLGTYEGMIKHNLHTIVEALK
ncbi:MAG: zinc ABC transporter substrate-binding protein [Opitutaceae bacterium]|nr:zinc ABC transporter substrate-binding protein [Verrucomicrobiales bacterium]